MYVRENLIFTAGFDHFTFQKVCELDVNEELVKKN